MPLLSFHISRICDSESWAHQCVEKVLGHQLVGNVTAGSSFLGGGIRASEVRKNPPFLFSFTKFHLYRSLYIDLSLWELWWWSIWSQTRAGDVSVEEHTMPEKSGRRRHSAAVEMAVAVSRRSGWRIRLFLDEMVIEDVKDDEDCESGVSKCADSTYHLISLSS